MKKMTRKEFLQRVAALGLGNVAFPSLMPTAIAKRNFDGKVLIIGAGAAGMFAGYELARQGIDFEIIEATSVYGGRVKQLIGFADFPVSLGAEWIHSDEPYELLNELIHHSEIPVDVNVIPFDPRNTAEWTGTQLIPLPFSGDDELEYKFKNTSWYDFLARYVAPHVQNNIHYSSPVSNINYRADKVRVDTATKTFEGDRVLVTVSMGVLQANMITFEPALSQKKISAIADYTFMPGLKVFIKFSEHFYHDAIYYDTTDSDEKLFFDIALRKGSADNVYGFFFVGENAGEYTDLPDDDAIINKVMSQLDLFYDGKASRYYEKHYIQNWSKAPYTLGAYSDDNSKRRRRTVLEPLDNKIYFAGEALNSNHWSTVDGAAVSALLVLEQLLLA